MQCGVGSGVTSNGDFRTWASRWSIILGVRGGLKRPPSHLLPRKSRPMTKKRLFASALLAVLATLSHGLVAEAKLKMSSVFGDHMVVQRDKPIHVLGLVLAR